MSDNKTTTIHHFKIGESFAEQGRFVLEGLLGVGGFADVYKARDTWSDLVIALKIYTTLNDDDIMSLSKEYARMAHLSHPNILRADYFGNWGTVPYLMMQYCEGGSLDRRLGKLNEEELYGMVMDVAKGLEYLHSRHIVHQDIKPANILIDLTEIGTTYKLSDFGISNKSKTQLSKSVRMAQAELSLTVAYAPPEKFSSVKIEREADPRGDIFSFGLTIYEVIAEELPLGDISTGNQMYHYPATKIDLSEIPYPRLRWIVDRCVQRDRDNRPSAKDIQEMLIVDEAEIPRHYFEKDTSTIQQEGKEEHLEETEAARADEANRKAEERRKAEETAAIKAEKAAEKERLRKEKEAAKEARREEKARRAEEEKRREEEARDNKTVTIHTDAPGHNRKNTGLIIGLICVVLVIAGGIGCWLAMYSTKQTSEDNDAAAKDYTVQTESIQYPGGTIEMVLIPGGEMVPGHDLASESASGKRVAVSDFLLGRTEVTQKLWQSVTGSNPSTVRGDNLPVNNVSWTDCQAFISKLNEKTGKKFRLPTETEWEYAAKMQPGHENSLYPGIASDPSVLGWFKDNSSSTIHTVGGKGMNVFGLYDMEGNVIEWCSDTYTDYASGKPLKGIGNKVLRGGYYDSEAAAVRTTARGSAEKDNKSPAFGLRLALDK